MSNWRRGGFVATIASVVFILIVLVKDYWTGSDIRYGPYQLAVLVTGIVTFLIGIEISRGMSSTIKQIFERQRYLIVFWFLIQGFLLTSAMFANQFWGEGLSVNTLGAIVVSFIVLSLAVWVIFKARQSYSMNIQNYWTRFDYTQDSVAGNLSFLSNLLKWIPLLAISVIVVQFLLFRTNLLYNLAPYYPGYYDQLTTYIETYQLHYFIRDRGILESFRESLTVEHFAFRGWVVTSLSVISTFLFGNNRLSIASINFLFFLIGQAGLWFVLNRQRGFVTALTGTGLLLFSNTYYLDRIGGLMDMRLDYAGMTMFGLSILSLVFFIEKPTYKKLYLSLFLFLVSLITRSITIAYLLGTQGILMIYFLCRLWIKGDEKERVRFLFLLLAGTIIVFILFIAVMWRGLDSYYVNLFRSGEGAIRDAEFGLTLFDRPVYYLRSVFDHFGRYKFVILLALSGLMIGIVRSQTDKSWVALKKPDEGGLFYSFMVFISAVLAVFLVVNVYAPSPVVMSVLTIPFVYILSMMLTDSLTWLRPSSVRIIAAVIAMSGFVNYVTAMSTTGQNLPYIDQENGQLVNQIYEDINRYIEVGENPAVYFMLIDAGLNRGAFEVYWYEHRVGTPPGAQHPGLYLFAIDKQNLMNFIDSADIIIAFVQMPLDGQFEFPFHTSLRELQSVWQPYLETKFIRVNTYDFSKRDLSIGLYVRQVP